MNRKQRRIDSKLGKPTPSAAMSLDTQRMFADALRHHQVCPSVPHRIGAPELAAVDAAGFVEIAAVLAADPGRLSGYRQDLRPRVKASPLVDVALHIIELEAAYRTMWYRHCAGL